MVGCIKVVSSSLHPSTFLLMKAPGCPQQLPNSIVRNAPPKKKASKNPPSNTYLPANPATKNPKMSPSSSGVKGAGGGVFWRHFKRYTSLASCFTYLSTWVSCAVESPQRSWIQKQQDEHQRPEDRRMRTRRRRRRRTTATTTTKLATADLTTTTITTTIAAVAMAISPILKDDLP